MNTFLSFRRNINRINNEFFGSPPNVDIKLTDINTKLNDIIGGIPDIIQKTNLIKIPHNQIRNIVYTVAYGFGSWTPENSTIKYTAEITGIYRMSVLSIADFRISTTNPSTENSFKTISVLLDKDSEGTFTLASSSRNLPQAYW